MRDYIKREDVKHMLCSFCREPKCHSGCNVPVVVGLLPTADVVEPPRWIPVTERLPAEGQNVICYSKIYGAHEAIARQGRHYMLFLDPNEEYFEFTYVTHWMEMPSAPKEDNDDNC